MTASAFAQSTYANPQTAIHTERGIEYQAFARATRRLKRAIGDGDGAFADLAEALHENQRLWIALASDVARDANSLPQQLRAQLFYLNEFTQAHSRKVLSGRGDLDVLVDINTAVMRGLRGHQGDP
ncbi:MAG: flagellar biosynthesis regulator FlaF [Pseudomonadota bacterium]